VKHIHSEKGLTVERWLTFEDKADSQFSQPGAAHRKKVEQRRHMHRAFLPALTKPLASLKVCSKSARVGSDAQERP
jgi:hypothetical protein